MTVALVEKWPVLGRHDRAVEWLQIWTDLGRAPRTMDAYARGLAEYLQVCEREGIDPLTATRAQVAVFVRELTSRPSRRGTNVVALDSGSGLANATLQQRLVPVRLFYDFLVEEGVCESNPVGGSRYIPGRASGSRASALVPRMVKLAWIPSEADWLKLLGVVADEPIRNRVMLALAYDAALRREELCSLRSDDLDPAHRHAAGACGDHQDPPRTGGAVLGAHGCAAVAVPGHRVTLSRARGGLFLSESHRNLAEPITFVDVVEGGAANALAANVPRFSTHTTRHLCLTDLARMGWELHTIATFAGHRSTDSTLQYIRLSGRELSAKLNSSMVQIHAWRIGMLIGPGVEQDAPV